MPGSNYFSYFPTITYDSIDGSKKTATDIFKRAKMTQLSANVKANLFYKYTIQDGDRPEHLAYKYYGDTQYYWVILYANNIINIYAQWPLTYHEFEKYIIDKYGSFEEANSVIHHYEDTDGNWVDYNPSTNPITNYDYEYKLNEDKREINIIKKDYLIQIITEMNKIFS